MDNKDKIVLDLCGGTGSWSRPYKDAGFDVRVITLPTDIRLFKYTKDNTLSLKDKLKLIWMIFVLVYYSNDLTVKELLESYDMWRN